MGNVTFTQELKEVSEQHIELFKAVLEKLDTWRSFLIAIDGQDGAGKSSLGRFLSLQTDMPCIETDLYLNPANEDIDYLETELARVVDSRLSHGDVGRPVIVEGIFVLELLGRIGFSPDYLIYVEREGHLGCSEWQDKFARYQKEYKSRCKADFQFFLPDR